MSEKRSKFHGLFPIESAEPPAVPVEDEPARDDAPAAASIRPPQAPQSRNQENKKSSDQEIKSSSDQENKLSRNQENKLSRNQAIKNSAHDEPQPIARLKTNYEIRQDYHRKLKNIANDEGRKMYQVIEEAIGRYLKAKGRL